MQLHISFKKKVTWNIYFAPQQIKIQGYSSVSFQGCLKAKLVMDTTSPEYSQVVGERYQGEIEVTQEWVLPKMTMVAGSVWAELCRINAWLSAAFFFQVKPISRFFLSIIIVPGSHWENMFQAIGAFFPRQDFPNHALYPVNWYEQVLLEKISQLITWSDVVEFI